MSAQVGQMETRSALPHGEASQSRCADDTADPVTAAGCTPDILSRNAGEATIHRRSLAALDCFLPAMVTVQCKTGAQCGALNIKPEVRRAARLVPDMLFFFRRVQRS